MTASRIFKKSLRILMIVIMSILALAGAYIIGYFGGGPLGAILHKFIDYPESKFGGFLASTLWRDHEHAAAVLPDKRKGEQIVLLTTFPKADRSELQRWAQDHGVNELSLPRKIYQVPSIPVLGTGKMDIGGVQKLAAEIAAGADAGSQAAE